MHVRRPRLDYESHAIALDRNEVGALLVAAGLGAPSPTATALAESWAANVDGLCRGARMELNDQELAELREWVGGGLLG